jgi:hypothetical protein
VVAGADRLGLGGRGALADLDGDAGVLGGEGGDHRRDADAARALGGLHDPQADRAAQGAANLVDGVGHRRGGAQRCAHGAIVIACADDR